MTLMCSQSVVRRISDRGLMVGIALFAMRFALAATFPFLSGCAALHRAALRETEVYFRSETLERYPPKPPDQTIPVLNSRPAKSEILGAFQFTTSKGAKFAMESALYNARKCGADAIYVRNLQDWSQPYAYYVPAQTSFIPSTHFISGSIWVPARGGSPGYWARRNAAVQSFGMSYSPAHTVSGWNHFSSIDAVMLRIPEKR